MIKRFLKIEWEFVIGLIAAGVALIMHFLNLVNIDLLLVILVVLVALLFLRNIREEQKDEAIVKSIHRTEESIKLINLNTTPSEVLLLGPRRLRVETRRFCKSAQGDMLWFHVCMLMFKTQSLFDDLLKPAIENPLVTSIHFILDTDQQKLWETEIVPKLAGCIGKEKVKEPRWVEITENVSFILADINGDGGAECLLSFWGEPFMSYSLEQGIPRYIFHVRAHSELIARLVELERKYRLVH